MEPGPTRATRTEEALALRERGLLQAAIAETMGISQSTVSEMVGNARPRAVAPVDWQTTKDLLDEFKVLTAIGSGATPSPASLRPPHRVSGVVPPSAS